MEVVLTTLSTILKSTNNPSHFFTRNNLEEMLLVVLFKNLNIYIQKRKKQYCIRWGGYKRIDNNKKQQRQ